MSTTKGDFQLAALAAGFTIGFGFLTVWEAMKQTRRNRNPLRSVYIYMLWGEIVANIVIGVIGWLFLNGALGPTVPVLFFILLCWVFEIQLLMQIIINRIALIAEHRKTVSMMKWGTFAIISLVNIAVFCIWIPSHTNPPASTTLVKINNVWDKISKVIILVVDAYLNWYFLRTVKTRLVQQHGLVKYQPLVGFNAKLMIVSIAMDGMLIGLMFLKNQVVYIQFHPVAYMVKLNIEMSMASLVVRLARGKSDTDDYDFHSSTANKHSAPHNPTRRRSGAKQGDNYFESFQLSSKTHAERGHRPSDSDSTVEQFGITCRTDVIVESVEEEGSVTKERSLNETIGDAFGDEAPLNKVAARVKEQHIV